MREIYGNKRREGMRKKGKSNKCDREESGKKKRKRVRLRRGRG